MLKRLVVMVAAACLALAALAVPASAQDSNDRTGLTKTVEITGQAKNGKKFVGTFTIDRFAKSGDKVVAVGTLKGRLKGRNVNRSNVRIPVQNVSLGAVEGARASQAACDILNLDLGPLDLNLLGLRVQLNRVQLDITAVPGTGILGDLLCGLLGGLPNPLGDLTNALNDLTAVLNSLLALVPTRP